MNLFVHTAAGALVAQYTGNPFLAFLYGLLSHIFLDMLPHGDSLFYKKYKSKEVSMKNAAAHTILDAVGSIIVAVIVFNLNTPASNLILGMAIVGSVLPDVMIGFYELLFPNAPHFLRVIHKWHFKNHDLIAEKFDLSFKNGILLQMVIFIFLIRKIL